MSKKVDYPYNREIAKKANEKLDNIEVVLCFSFLFSLTLVIVLQSAIPLYCGIAILVIYTIWCFKYDKKYHCSTYIQEETRKSKGIVYCPYCGSTELEDKDIETTCTSCGKEIKF